MEFKSLAKNTSLLAVTRLFEVIAGFIRIKLTAVILGTTGMGIVEQLTFFTQQASTFTLLSMSEAVVKQIAENKSSVNASELIRSALKSYILVIVSFMIISMLALYIFRNPLSLYVFGDNMYSSYIYIAIFALPFLILNSIPFAIMKAFKNMLAISKARIYIVFINLIVVLPAIYFYQLDGAVYAVPLTYLITLVINYIFARQSYLLTYDIAIIAILKTKVTISFLRELFVFSGFGLTVGLYFIISEFIIRSIVITELGVDSIGLYSPVIMWASMVTGIVLPSLSTYLYPRFCELKSDLVISDLMNDSLRLGTLALIPLLFLGIPYSHLFISLFYTNEFLDAAKYVPYHFLGVVFYVWWYVFSQSMTPTGRIKQHGIFLFLFYSLNIIVTYVFVGYFDLYGWMLKFIVSPFLFFWIYYFYVRRYMHFHIDMRNFSLMSYLLTMSLALIFIDSFVNNGSKIILFLGPIMMFGTVLLLNKLEIDYLLKILNKIKITSKNDSE